MHEIPPIDTTWSLFLDRDGVINIEKEQGYVTTYDDFIFYDGALEALHILSLLFGKIIIVTNQRGVGKGLMHESDLHTIHAHMQNEIAATHGRIDAVYYCTALSDTDENRKPNTGMALQAMRDFPDITPKKCIMVGNKLHDMEFGKRSGMSTIFIETTNPDTKNPHPLIDARFDSLIAFATFLKQTEVGTPRLLLTNNPNIIFSSKKGDSPS